MKASSITTRARAVRERLARRYPAPRTELTWTTPWELLVATILSAQCTDARVNTVTPELFATWESVEQMAGAKPAQIEAVIRSTGFFRNKAKNLHASAVKIVTEFDGHVPRTMEEMLTLPGVARKTANVVRGEVFGLADGITVDTHVKRLAARLGLTAETDPVKVERDLMAIIPRDSWIEIAHLLIWHGRRVCTARKPACPDCPLNDVCPSAAGQQAVEQ